MEEFRKKIRRRAHISAALCLLAPAILIALQIITKRPMDYASGVVYGAFGSLMVVAVFNVARLFSALGDEEKLKKMYIAETDERNIALGKETGSTTLEISVSGLAFAAIAASFFSTTVSLTFAAAVFFIGLVAAAVRTYYNKKM